MPIQHKPLLLASTMSLGLQTPWLSLQLPLWPCVRLMLSTRHRSELIGHENWRYFAKLFDQKLYHTTQHHIADLQMFTHSDLKIWRQYLKILQKPCWQNTRFFKQLTFTRIGEIYDWVIWVLFPQNRSEAGTPWRKLDNASNFAACDGGREEGRHGGHHEWKR